MLTRQSCQETGVLPCPPVTRAPFRIVDAYLAFLLLWESSLADSPHLTRRIDIFLQMSLAPVGVGIGVECQGLTPLLCVTV